MDSLEKEVKSMEKEVIWRSRIGNSELFNDKMKSS